MTVNGAKISVSGGWLRFRWNFRQHSNSTGRASGTDGVAHDAEGWAPLPQRMLLHVLQLVCRLLLQRERLSGGAQALVMHAWYLPHIGVAACEAAACRLQRWHGPCKAAGIRSSLVESVSSTVDGKSVLPFRGPQADLSSDAPGALAQVAHGSHRCTPIKRSTQPLHERHVVASGARVARPDQNLPEHNAVQ